MVLFSSARERRLWLWTLAVVVAIYSTLGISRTLAEYLREHGLLEAASFVLFLLGLLLVGATIVTQGVKARPGGQRSPLRWVSRLPTCWCSSGWRFWRSARTLSSMVC